MAELTGPGFKHGNSFLHELDPRFKIFILLIFTIINFHTDFQGQLVFTLIILFALVRIKISFILIIKEIRYFIFFLFIIFFVRMFTTPGPEIFRFKSLIATTCGIKQGALICWRLLVVVFLGIIFVMTTRNPEIRGAVIRILRPVPGICEKRAGTMISLVVRFIPMILNQAKETSDIQKARGIEMRKNPVYRLTKFTIPFMRRIFLDADNLIIAMESRCYNEDRTSPVFYATGKDWFILWVSILICVVLILPGVN